MRVLQPVAAASAAALLNACTLGIGGGDFACPGYPSKPLCLPPSEVYRLTDGAGPPPAALAAPPKETTR